MAIIIGRLTLTRVAELSNIGARVNRKGRALQKYIGGFYKGK
jgi:hypothetical protein